MNRVSLYVLAITAMTCSFQAQAVTYTTGEKAASSSAITPVVSQTVSGANINNVGSHLDIIVGTISGAVPIAPVPVTPSVTVSPQLETSGITNGKKTVSLFDTSNQKGYSAGDDKNSSSLWGNLSYTLIESTATDAEFDGDVAALNVGIDKWFSDKFLGGLSIGYAQTKVDTKFNSGDYEESATTLAAYGLMRLTDKINVSAMGGYIFSDIEQKRQGSSVTSDADAGTIFGNLQLSSSHSFGQIDTTARLGYLWANRDTDNFNESDNNVVAATSTMTNQGKIGAQAAYSYTLSNTVLKPYVSLDYLHDFDNAVNGDKDAFDTGVGFNVSSSDGTFEGQVEVKTQLGRSDFEKTAGTVTLRYNF